jgi:hypothetical protein
VPTHAAFFYRLPLVGGNTLAACWKIEQVLGILPIERADAGVWAGGHAHPTADALIVILSNGTGYLVLVRCAYRTNPGACRIFTMLAGYRHIAHLDIGEHTLGGIHLLATDRQRSVPPNIRRNIVLNAAADSTGMASDTPLGIYNESVSHNSTS